MLTENMILFRECQPKDMNDSELILPGPVFVFAK